MNAAPPPEKRKHVRLRHYDYSTAGYYFVTICTALRKRGLADRKDWLESWFLRLPEQFENVEIDWRVSMPDHVHFLLRLAGGSAALPRIIQWFKARTTLDAKKAGWVSAPRLWQPNYYEHVVRTEKSLLKIREYIENNPRAEIPWQKLDP